MRYKGSDQSIRQIAEELGVGTILEGSVRRVGNRVRIVAQLIDAHTDEHLWAETYDRELTDIFTIQSDVALSVAQALQTTLTTNEQQNLSATPTESIEAYDSYLLGQHHWYRFTEEGAKKAGHYFNQSVALDPTFAPAHAGLANLALLLGGAPLNVLPASQAIPDAKRAAERALSLDPSVGSAYEVLVVVQCWFEWDWIGARKTAIEAIEAAPNSGLVWSAFGHAHDVCSMHREAIRGVSRALQLDPMSGLILQNAAWVHYHARQYEEARRYVDRLLDLQPGFPIGVFTLAEILLAQGQDEEACSVIEPMSEVMASYDYGMAILALALGRVGQTARALQIADQLEGQCREHRAAWPDVALAYLGVGELDRALDFLEKAPDQRPAGGLMTAYLGVLPLFDPLRDHSRFKAVLARLGLTDVGVSGSAAQDA